MDRVADLKRVQVVLRRRELNLDLIVVFPGQLHDTSAQKVGQHGITSFRQSWNRRTSPLEPSHRARLVTLHRLRQRQVPLSTVKSQAAYSPIVIADAVGWTFSDAWVFAAVAISEVEGCDLAHLIGVADGINHAILTADELAQAVGRFVASGLLTHEHGWFRLTEEGAALAARGKGGLFSQVPSVQKLLARQPLTEGRWDVSQEAVHRAFKTYRDGLRDR